jgi:hypothetical protein
MPERAHPSTTRPSKAAITYELTVTDATNGLIERAGSAQTQSAEP